MGERSRRSEYHLHHLREKKELRYTEKMCQSHQESLTILGKKKEEGK